MCLCQLHFGGEVELLPDILLAVELVEGSEIIGCGFQRLPAGDGRYDIGGLEFYIDVAILHAALDPIIVRELCVAYLRRGDELIEFVHNLLLALLARVTAAIIRLAGVDGRAIQGIAFRILDIRLHQFVALMEADHGAASIAKLIERLGACVIDRVEAGITPRYGIEIVECRTILSTLQVHQTQVVAGMEIVGLQFEHFAEVFGGAVEVLHFIAQEGAVEECRRVVGL